MSVNKQGLRTELMLSWAGSISFESTLAPLITCFTTPCQLSHLCMDTLTRKMSSKRSQHTYTRQNRLDYDLELNGHQSMTRVRGHDETRVRALTKWQRRAGKLLMNANTHFFNRIYSTLPIYNTCIKHYTPFHLSIHQSLQSFLYVYWRSWWLLLIYFLLV